MMLFVINNARIQIRRKSFQGETKLCVSRICSTSTKRVCLELSHTLYLYTAKIIWHTTLFWFLRHNSSLWNGILVILLFFWKEKSPCPNKNYAKNWLCMISKLETNWNRNESGLDNSSDNVNLKKKHDTLKWMNEMKL